MSAVHVVYRAYDEGPEESLWAVYSFPTGVYLSEDSLAGARDAFAVAARDLFGDQLRAVAVSEHLEHPVCPGVYMRVAVDQHSLARQDAARAFRAWLCGGPRAAQSREQFEATVPPSASGDRIVVACVPEDPISWLVEQMDPHDTVAVCIPGVLAGDRLRVPWTFLVREQVPEVEPDMVRGLRRLSEWGLDPDATVGELLRADPGGSEFPGGVLVTA